MKFHSKNFLQNISKINFFKIHNTFSKYFMRIIISIILIIINNFTIAQTYGPTKTGDLLWNIAGEVRPDKSISRYQAMLSLLKANRHSKNNF